MVFKLLYSLIKKISLKQTRLFENTSAMIIDKKKNYNNVVPTVEHTHLPLLKQKIKINYLYLKKNKN